MKTIITRADDCASSHAANLAVARAADAGFLKNVSVMAVCPFVQEAADLLAHRKDLCFGLHVTLNSEWDRVRWAPLTKAACLTDERGALYQDPSLFALHPPCLEEVMEEIEAQYARLMAAGFSLRYAECHMLPERWIPGLEQELTAWCEKKGLLDFGFYADRVLPQMDELSVTPGLLEQVLKTLPDGQYAYITHPALYTEEMLLTGNGTVSGEQVARHRAADAAFLADRRTKQVCEAAGVSLIRLDEAKRLPRHVAGMGLA